ncbi:MAG TPA: gluconate 2-dehydrogenase subunit 3 family protein, partial [Vicinamibacterales bacterium]|nr:gluconate 2-dehydrogenase subunit 3 family protein [Vicinamibacterales bacterium]
RPLATGTAPRALPAALFPLLARAVDLILPPTDTPGAAAAGVHWVLDDAAQTDADLRATLSAGLARLDARARARHGRGFLALEPPAQTALLAEISDLPEGAAAAPEDRAFFALLKARTLDAYYRSEIGQIGELEWVGHEFHDEFPGACPHPDPLVHPRPRWPRRRR